MNVMNRLTTTKEQTRGPESQTPRELAQNSAEASTHILLAATIVLCFAIYGLREGSDLHRLQPIPQVVLFSAVAIIIVRRFVYGIELHRLNSLSKTDFKQGILSKLVATVQDIVDGDDGPNEVGVFQPLSDWFEKRKKTTDEAAPNWTAKLKHFPVCPSDVVAYVQHAEREFDGQLSERLWLDVEEDEKFVFPVKKATISQPLIRQMQQGCAEWGYAWKTGNKGWCLRDSAEVIAAHIKDRTSM